MKLELSAEQQQLRDTATGYLAKAASPDTVARWLDADGWDPAGWPELADLGWLDADLGLFDEVVLLEATAAAVLPAPVFSTRLVLPVLDASSRQDVSDGSLRVALAWAESGRPTGFTDAVASAAALDRGRVTGRKELVADADKVDAFVVVASGPTGPSLALVVAADAHVTPRSTVDRSRRLSDVEFRDAPATVLQTESDALESLELRAYVLAAAEALGAGGRAVHLAVQHARDRHQFGKPIGGYQAVSHRLVDAHTDLELARSLAYWAAHCVETGDPWRAAAAAAAKARATAAAVRACEAAIQIAGGLGMTWEHPLHRLYKRAQWLDGYLAGERRLYRTVADALFPPG